MKPTIFITFIFFVFACQHPVSETVQSDYFQITGKTMGTITYKIVYEDSSKRNFKNEVDSILTAFNNEVSVYVPTSVISKFNRNEIDFSKADNQLNSYPHFKKNIVAALQIAQKTEGAFDPTIMPIVNYWGFGSAGKKPVEAIDSIKVDSILSYVGYTNLNYNDSISVKGEIESLAKSDARVTVDLGGLAKGYALDIVAEFLHKNGVKNYMIEIGLEVKTRGKNPKGDIWKIGISTPKNDAQLTDIQEIVKLHNTSIATSGNYRQYYEVDGQKLAHIVNPSTGFPEHSNLLSVSVIHQDCMIADAYATAFMVMGMEKSMQLVEQNDDLEALFIYGNVNGTMETALSTGMKKMIIQ